MLRMGSINRYIFRTTLGAFLVVLVSLTAVIWVTQALRDIDIMTNQGQTILVFVGITGLIIPLLVLVIAPIALLIAVAHVLNKMSNDFEIIVMNAAGMSPWILFRAFVAAALVVSLLVGAISAYFAPKGLRMLRDWLTEVRANVVSSIVQPGRFTPSKAASPSTFASGARTDNLPAFFLTTGAIRTNASPFSPKSASCSTTTAERFWFSRKASCSGTKPTSAIRPWSAFDRYAFDLSQFAGGAQAVKYSIRERYLWQLLFPDPKDPVLPRATRSVPRRIARPADGAVLSARLRRNRLCLSRRPAYDATKPHALDARSGRRRRVIAADRLCINRIRRRCAMAAVVAISGNGRRVRPRICT